MGGAVLLGMLAYDIFFTVFHSRGRGGPVNRTISAAVWRVAHRFGRRRDGTARDGLLSLAGPAIVLAALLTWVMLLVGAFALIYYPWIGSFLVSPGSTRTGWSEALYYSGYVAATLGLGDLVPDLPALRLLTVLEALGGFAIVSVAITYFLAVYRELVAMQSLAADIAALCARGTSPLLDFTRSHGTAMLARWSEQFSAALSHVLLAHFQYPVLHYFRPLVPSRALPVQLGMLLRLREEVAAEAARGSDGEIGTLASHPSFVALNHTLDEYLAEVDRLFVRPERRGATKGGAGESSRRHDRLLEYMLY